jgi:hypothetical protein
MLRKSILDARETLQQETETKTARNGAIIKSLKPLTSSYKKLPSLTNKLEF